MSTPIIGPKDGKGPAGAEHSDPRTEAVVRHFLTWRDLYGGVLLLLLGIGAVVEGLSHQVGNLFRMGTGYFPIILGVTLGCIGAAIAIGTLMKGGGTTQLEPGEHFHLPDVRGFVAIVGGILAFIGLAEFVGFAPATFALVFISAMGDRTMTLKAALVLASVMTGVLIGLFWYALQIPLKLW
ncbi:tripartite tricarboxylate transporter TctB family protein [Aquabacter sp. L1I39]|uniref:tripartite tricarboxylate transporter TctB family protein n=1 Tax=Aquabacter sp. L1I39 TaxID=2820278 RepID=UPI001ADAEDD9|nr:tripartite tricarboxylate transporter TctB family protein [Aquabacter sp. L1I39]QTL02550.1 tripartite tricarboxylate transporter TctB family protein [Aquabacter sp. L1I39]